MKDKNHTCDVCGIIDDILHQYGIADILHQRVRIRKPKLWTEKNAYKYMDIDHKEQSYGLCKRIAAYYIKLEDGDGEYIAIRCIFQHRNGFIVVYDVLPHKYQYSFGYRTMFDYNEKDKPYHKKNLYHFPIPKKDRIYVSAF